MFECKREQKNNFGNVTALEKKQIGGLLSFMVDLNAKQHL